MSTAVTTRSRASRTFTGSRTIRSSSARNYPRPKYESQSLALSRARPLRLRHAGGAGVAVRARAAAAARRAGADDRRLRRAHVLDQHDLRAHAPSAADEPPRGGGAHFVD